MGIGFLMRDWCLVFFMKEGNKESQRHTHELVMLDVEKFSQLSTVRKNKY